MDIRKDYYATLGVLPSIDDAALKAACRALVKKYHPDVAESQKTDGRAAEIIEAYRVLGDADRRNAYDSARKEIEYAAPERVNLRPARMRRQPRFMRSLVTAYIVGYGIRSLVSVCVLGLIVLGPVGARLVDALKPLSGLTVGGDFNSFHSPSHTVNGERYVIRHVKHDASDGGARDDETLIVSSEMHGSMKVIHVEKKPGNASADDQPGFIERLYRKLFGQ